MLRRSYTPFAQIDIKNCLIKILDGSGTPNSITIKVGEGNITWTEKKARVYVKDRGLLDGVRDGDEEPVELKLACRWDFYKSVTADGEAVTPLEAIKKIGAASAWVTTGADACEPYSVDVVIEDILGCGTVLDEKITFDEFRYESVEFDLRAGTFNISGMCNVTEPTVLRTAL